MRLAALIAMLWLLASPAYAAAPPCMNGHPAHAICYADPFTVSTPGHAGTVGDPLQTWSEFTSNALPGDTLMINCNGTYSVTLFINEQGTAGNPISFIGNCSIPAGTSLATLGANATPALLTGTAGAGSHSIQINQGSQYLVFQNIACSATTANKNCFFTSQDLSFLVVTNHITVDHMTALNNSCGSFEFDGTDYITITNSVAHDNGATCSVASESAFHWYQPTMSDNLSGVHILASNDWAYNESKGINVGHESDGVGYETDDGNGTQGSHCINWPTRCPYTGQIVIQNSIGNNNDSNGFEAFQTNAPTEIVNDDFYLDDQNQSSGSVFAEVVTNNSNSVSIYNSIMVPKTTAYNCGLALSNASGVTTFNADDCFGATTAYSSSSASLSLGAANVTGNPNFTSPPTDFSLTSPSACIGTANGAVAPALNMFGATRTGSGGVCTAVGNPNMGAI